MNDRASQELDLLLQEGRADNPLLAEGLVRLYANHLFRFAWEIFIPQTGSETVRRFIAKRATARALIEALDQLHRFQEQPETFLWLLKLTCQQTDHQNHRRNSTAQLAAYLSTAHNLPPESIAFIFKGSEKREAVYDGGETAPQNGPRPVSNPAPLTPEEITSLVETVQTWQTQSARNQLPFYFRHLAWISAVALFFFLLVRAAPNHVINLPTPVPTPVPPVTPQPDWQATPLPLSTADNLPGTETFYEPENPYLIWQQTHTLEGDGTFTSLAFSPTTPLLAAGTNQGDIFLWDASDFSSNYQLDRITGSFPSLAFSPDGGYLAIGASDGTVRLWEIIEEPYPHGLLARVLDGPSNTINSLAFSPDGGTIAVGTGKMVWFWQLDGGAKLPWDRFDLTITSVAFSPHGRWLAAGEGGGTGWIMNASNGEPLFSFDNDARFGNHTLKFSPDGKYLAANSREGSVKIIELRLDEDGLDGVLVRTLLKNSEEYSNPEIQDFNYATDGSFFAAATSDGRVSLWDTTTWTPLQAPVGGYTYDNPYKAVAITPDGKTIAAGRTGEISIFQLRDVQAQVDLLETPSFFTRLENDWYTIQYVVPDPEEQELFIEENSGLSIEEASARAGFEVKTPMTGLLQGDYQSDGAFYIPESQTVLISYWNSTGNEFSFSLLQRRVDPERSGFTLSSYWYWITLDYIGKTAVLIPIQDGDFYGEWLAGSWTTLSEENQDIYGQIETPQPGEKVPIIIRWTTQGDSYRLRWMEEDILYEIIVYRNQQWETKEEEIRAIMLLLASSIFAPQQINFPWNASQFTYTIQPGDTCTTLAEQFLTTIETIINLNALSTECNLLAGQTLQLPYPAEPFITSDLNCDGQDEALLLLRDPDEPTRLIGLALDVTSETNITRRVWEFKAGEMGVLSILHDPELFSIGECDQLIAVRGGDPTLEGGSGAYRTRIFRWNGNSVWPVLDGEGWPASQDGLIATLPQSQGDPFTIPLVLYAATPHPSTGLCPNKVTEYSWNGLRFDRGLTRLISEECQGRD